MSLRERVVRTKLTPPVARRRDIPRERLLGRLGTAPLGRLTIFSAPAGFGKSTLLGQLNALLLDRGLRTAWLSADERDRDPKRFLYHVIAACRLAVPEAAASALSYLDNAMEPDTAMVLTPLVNDLYDSGAEVCLFIDDYHFIDEPRINEFMELFINLAPPGLHIVIASRMMPHLPVTTLRVRGDVQEFTAADLRFDQHEAERFLAGDRDACLSRDEASALGTRAEGWPAGLQLALLSMRNPDRREMVTMDLSTSLRDVTDYLATEVLDQQSPTMREFMLKTAVLGRMNADLCAQLTGRANAQELLALMEEEHLFLIPLDQTSTWFRYHHLFHDFLQARLRREYPGELVELNRAAAACFEQAGLLEEAFDHALLTGDAARIAELVTNHGRRNIALGRAPQLIAWCQRIPEAIKAEFPITRAIEALGLFHMRGHERASELLRQLDSLPDGRRTALLDTYLKIIRAGIAMSEDDVEQALPPLAGKLPGADDFALGTINNIAGYSLAELGETERAREHLLTSRQYHETNQAPFGVAYSDCFLALIDYEHGDLEHALSQVDSLRLSDSLAPDSFVPPVPDALRGIIYCEQNRLEEAGALLRATLPMLQKVGHINVVARGYCALARAQAADGQFDLAMQTLEHARSLLPQNRAGRLRTQSIIEATTGRLALQHGQTAVLVNAAARLAVEADSSIATGDHWQRVPCTRLLLKAWTDFSRGDAARALAHAETLIALASAAERRVWLIEYLLLAAAAEQSLGEAGRAGRRIDQVLANAEAAGVIRALCECLPQLLPLIGARMESYPNTRYALRLKRALRSAERQTRSGPAGAAVSALSDREAEILALIAAGLPNPDIAERLTISQNTVKWHVKNIFGKLNVSNRTEAVVTAQQSGLLPGPLALDSD